ncbi:SNARE protein, partial [Trinorchestia longiramus]
MTTRRRRAGSDSNSIEIGDSEHLSQEPPLPGQPAVINPLFSVPVINPAVVPGSVLVSNVPNFGIARQPSALQQEAYYKKTDNPPFPSKQFAPRIFTPQNSAFHNSVNSSSQSSNSSFVSNFQGLGGGISNYFNTALKPSSQTASHLTHPAPDSDSTGELEIPKLGRLNGLDGIEEISVMAFRDRTSEFSGIIKKSQQQGPHGYSNGVLKGPASKGHRDLSHYSNFMKHSRMVGRNISSTYAKLEKLTLLAKKRSLFDDSQDMEVQELTAIIRHDLTSLTKQLEDLRRSSSASSASSTSHMQKHSANLVGSLQTKVATITQKFRDVLEVRTENLKKQAERRDQFTGGGSSNSALLPGSGSAHPASVLLADEAKANAAARRSTAGGGG